MREHNLPGATVSIDHVKAVVMYDSNDDYKIANRLTDIHTSTEHHLKMKVNMHCNCFMKLLLQSGT